MTDILTQLAQPFPKKYIHENPSGGGSYIKHHVIEQRLIQVFGRPPNFERVEILFGDVAGYTTSNNKTYPDLKNVVVGVIARLSVTIGNELWISEEAGDCEQPHNWKTDGQRLKDAMSDAYKRCAMRWGCGLHLWSQDEYFLYDKLSSGTEQRTGSTSNSKAGAKAPSQSVAKSPTSGGEPAEPPAPPTSPVPAEEVEVAKSNGEVDSATPAEASSDGNVYELIATAMSDKAISTRVMTTANKIALKNSVIPKEGISRQTILDLPEEVLREVASELNLNQESLV